MDIDIAISTCDRDPQYLPDTLVSLYGADRACASVPLRLVVCGDSAAYLGDVTSKPEHPDVRIDLLSAAEWKQLQTLDIKRRILNNFVRVLAGGDARRPIIALQDDVRFARDWLTKTVEIADYAAGDHGEDFILALYAAYRFKRKPYFLYNPLRFYGNQALYMTPKARHGLLNYMYMADQFKPDDMMVKDYVQHSGTRLLAAYPSLVQHVGECSAVEDRFHRSPSFSV
jgi:hypothetical protein